MPFSLWQRQPSLRANPPLQRFGALSRAKIWPEQADFGHTQTRVPCVVYSGARVSTIYSIERLPSDVVVVLTDASGVLAPPHLSSLLASALDTAHSSSAAARSAAPACAP